ncbi:MAG TPA: polyprenyl diphosphate synthase [Steroidobacteraceae bacterium]|nr:polyprenyl diphosphate synthase [Steroidobacteraceae bacterium]
MTLPRHIAIIMDGNGRWASARGLPRQAGHKQGVEPVRMSIRECMQRKIGTLTLFAFSSENWGRPSEEVGALMGLFVDALDSEIDELHQNGVCVKFIGDRKGFPVRLQARMSSAEARTAGNSALQCQVAVGYGGRWDIVQAARQMAARCAAGELRASDITQEAFASALQLGGLPDPDLFIRTGGEKRISNFLLWNLAYTELYFCDVLWPDFGATEFAAALDFYASRQRRYGLTATQAGATP